MRPGEQAGWQVLQRWKEPVAPEAGPRGNGAVMVGTKTLAMAHVLPKNLTGPWAERTPRVCHALGSKLIEKESVRELSPDENKAQSLLISYSPTR